MDRQVLKNVPGLINYNSYAICPSSMIKQKKAQRFGFEKMEDITEDIISGWTHFQAIISKDLLVWKGAKHDENKHSSVNSFSQGASGHDWVHFKVYEMHDLCYSTTLSEHTDCSQQTSIMHQSWISK